MDTKNIKKVLTILHETWSKKASMERNIVQKSYALGCSDMLDIAVRLCDDTAEINDDGDIV